MTAFAARIERGAGPREIGWDDASTARYYEEFCSRHGRYDEANAALVAHAALAPGHSVLDIGAGTGRTAEAAAAHLGPEGQILCVEPAAAMREAGRSRLAVSRCAVKWTDRMPTERASFDRILCGAAIWLLEPLAGTFAMAARLLKPGGALVFNIPSLYLGIADEPGGGRDPSLLQLPSLLAAHGSVNGSHPAGTQERPDWPRPCGEIEELLATAGFRAERWTMRSPLQQEAYRDWLKIPVLTNRLLAGLAPEERAALVDEAYEKADRSSWRWESWTGWTAWAR